MLIDLVNFDSLRLTDAGTVLVGGGCLSGAVSSFLEPHGLDLPIGTCPSVGIGGLTLGGGFGYLGRRHGFTSDRLRSATIVLSNGSVVQVSADHEPDLFWALRGAGTVGFGIVTEFEFDPVPRRPISLFGLRWPGSECQSIVDTWLSYTLTAPNDVTMELTAMRSGRSDGIVTATGAIVGHDADAERTIADLLDQFATPTTIDLSMNVSSASLLAELSRQSGPDLDGR
jgi:FAD/FMN-containing dehydrogenase